MTKETKESLEEMEIDSSKLEDFILTEISEEEESDINEIKELIVGPVKDLIKEKVEKLIEKISFDSIMFSSISGIPIVVLEIMSNGDSVENVALNGKIIKVPESYTKFTNVGLLEMVNDNGETVRKIVEELRSENQINLKVIDELRGEETNE